MATRLRLGSGVDTTWRLYTGLAAEKILMVKIWYTVIGAGSFNIQFYIGANTVTAGDEISKLMAKANLPLTSNIAMGHVDAEEHHKFVSDAVAGDDLMMTRSGTASNQLTMDIQIFFEE
jgi:hypothetical protein